MNDNKPSWVYTYTSDNLSNILFDPIAPSLSLYCDQKNVFSVNMDKSMDGKSEVVMVEDGSDCFLDIDNVTTTLEESIWYINYTIYHDKAMQVDMGEGISFGEGLKKFKRFPDCSLDTIFIYGYNLEKIHYSDLTAKVDWLAKHDAGNQPCNDNFSI